VAGDDGELALIWLSTDGSARAEFRAHMRKAARDELKQGEPLVARPLAFFLRDCALSVPLDEEEITDIRKNYRVAGAVARAALLILQARPDQRVDFRKMKAQNDKVGMKEMLEVTAQGQ
jgi:hypothetical protein